MSGVTRYFNIGYNPDGYEDWSYHSTADEARAAAQAELDSGVMSEWVCIAAVGEVQE